MTWMSPLGALLVCCHSIKYTTMVRPRDRRFGRTPPSAGLIAWRRSTQTCSNHHVVALASRCHLPPLSLVPTCSSRQDAPSPATRTSLMQVGPIRPFSDPAGLHVVHLGDCAAGLSELATRLETAGCGVDRTGQDWLKVKFKASGEKPPVGAHAAPLHSCKVPPVARPRNHPSPFRYSCFVRWRYVVPRWLPRRGVESRISIAAGLKCIYLSSSDPEDLSALLLIRLFQLTTICCDQPVSATSWAPRMRRYGVGGRPAPRPSNV